MRDVVIPPERICDPVGKRFPAVGRDPERTPMQWSNAPGAGFTSAADTWLPIGPDYATVNVARQMDDPRSHLSFYRRLIWYRKAATALTHGTYRPLDGPAGYLRLSARAQRTSGCSIALNFAGEPRRVALPQFPAGRIEVSTDAGRKQGPVVLAALDLGSVEGLIVALQ